MGYKNSRVNKEWGLMTRNKLSGIQIKNIKCSACAGLMHVSRICPLSQLIRSRPASEGKKSIFAERKALDAKINQKENDDTNNDTLERKTVAFYLPSLIRIRATDKDGNSIEVTY
ncbi:hypothetical protein [Methanosarcina sp. 1.H.A.2.2]|uniref:hypothetical protein n=1 Tax=Methanosarcina sp. 1.H.A.2.2 TaxID=1483601 RepID=UPI0012E0ACC6|nr:hypothetical protein [Methanosarcina sp. 1.H.A.2.2]